MNWLKTILGGLGKIASLVLFLFKRKDANEPQKTLDKARTDAATGDDDALNADLDAAADRLRDQNKGG